jgi:2-amino-4-hydroxy-6-hydroxymethyldihydropteridine diphosphokinase
MHTTQPIYLAIGSNIEPRREYLRLAVDRLAEVIEPGQLSAVYETEPWGFVEQSKFLNQVIEGWTGLDPLDLLDKVKAIEADLGRTSTFRNGPRVIDIDILLYGQRIFTSERLTIPHPRMLERAFVLVPLNEIAPDLVIPGSGTRVREALEQLGPVSGVTRLAE